MSHTRTPTSPVSLLAVSSWDDVASLGPRMDDLADQADAIVGHARTWVCRPAGFEPSPVCVLRPLAAAMDPLDAAFALLGARLDDHWRDLSDGLRRAAADLAGADVGTAERMAHLTPPSAA